MPLRLEIKKILSSRSDRVKCVDLHPIEPWVLSALYSGSVFLWDFDTSTMIKSWEVCDLPVRTAKFIMRKQWFICASDDMHLRVFNYNTMEKVKAFEAHTDYIRFLEIHPSKPFVISSSDDMSMKLWCVDRPPARARGVPGARPARGERGSGARPRRRGTAPRDCRRARDARAHARDRRDRPRPNPRAPRRAGTGRKAGSAPPCTRATRTT